MIGGENNLREALRKWTGSNKIYYCLSGGDIFELIEERELHVSDFSQRLLDQTRQNKRQPAGSLKSSCSI